MKPFDHDFKRNNPELYHTSQELSFDKQISLWLGGFVRIIIVLGVLGIALSEGYLLIYKNFSGHDLVNELKNKNEKLEFLKE